MHIVQHPDFCEPIVRRVCPPKPKPEPKLVQILRQGFASGHKLDVFRNQILCLNCFQGSSCREPLGWILETCDKLEGVCHPSHRIHMRRLRGVLFCCRCGAWRTSHRKPLKLYRRCLPPTAAGRVVLNRLKKGRLPTSKVKVWPAEPCITGLCFDSSDGDF